MPPGTAGTSGRKKGKSKVAVRFEVEIHGLSAIDPSCDFNGVVFHWKRSGTLEGKGASQPVLLHSPETSLDPARDMTQFDMMCN